MSQVHSLIVEAKSHLGYVEGKGKDNKFGKWYGMNGAPWCAMFVSYCINEIGAGDLIKGAQGPKGFASCGYGIKFFKKKKAWFSVADAQPGDLAFFDWDKDGEQDHVGIVISNDPKTKTIKTVEGNTSDSSHSNGGTVQAKTRNYGVIMGVGRPAWKDKFGEGKPAEEKKPEPKPVDKPVEKPAVKPAGKTYTVKAGDSYWAIAEKNPIKGLATSEATKVLQKLNDNKPLHPGDVIKIK